MTEQTELTEAQLEVGRKLFAGSCEFIAGVATLDRMIDSSLPEIAFAGRSNVGKSSLINALTGRKTLARTSHTPGRTQQINFFDLSNKMHIVDLPGYGYARASKTKIQAWNDLIRIYLRGRQTLRRVCVLVDSRHGVKEVDTEIMKMLNDAAVTFQVVLTKSDKIKKHEIESRVKEMETLLNKHPAAFPQVIITSSAKGYGVPELRAILNDVISS